MITRYQYRLSALRRAKRRAKSQEWKDLWELKIQQLKNKNDSVSR